MFSEHEIVDELRHDQSSLKAVSLLPQLKYEDSIRKTIWILTFSFSPLLTMHWVSSSETLAQNQQDFFAPCIFL